MSGMNLRGPRIRIPIITGKRLAKPKTFSKKKKKIMKNTIFLSDHIEGVLSQAGVELDGAQSSDLFSLIYSNAGLFKFSFLQKAGIVTTRSSLRDMYDRVPMLYEGLDNRERETMDLDRDMEAFLKRKVTGEHIFLYFLRMRSRDHKMWYTTYAQVKNHWELDRMIEILEKSSHKLGFNGFSGLPYHMVIEGKHYDCVPLSCGDLPIEWALRVEIPECTCGTVNWERTGFIGSEWR